MKNKPEDIKSVFFLGIGGIGMSALARYFRNLGAEVSGYDRIAGDVARDLESEGISVIYEDEPSMMPESPDLVIYTPAIPSVHKGFRYYQAKEIPMKKRSEILGWLSQGHYTIAIAGTHGKTTISAMTTHLMKHAGLNISAFVGGIMKNYKTNIILSEKPEYFIAEADEYDRSFLQLFPHTAVISSMDADHLDIYGTCEDMRNAFASFVQNIHEGGTLVVRQGLSVPHREGINVYSYGPDSEADYSASDIRVENGAFHFTLNLRGECLEVRLAVPGRHNIENALAAAAVCKSRGIDAATIASGLESYRGVVRRFDVRYSDHDLVYIDDYAHHPAELKACITAVREMYPDRSIWGIFQPHLYSRTRDFADEFAQSLSLLDNLVLMPLYPAREEPIPGVDSEMLLNKVSCRNKQVLEPSRIPGYVANIKQGVLLTLGAGDIDRLCLPILSELEQRRQV